MNLNYTVTEGNDAVSRVILMMKYDLRKTLTENTILKEQPESVMDKRAEDLRLSQKQINNTLNDRPLDTHDYLTFIEVSAGLMGTITGPLAPVFYGISTAAGIADALLYFGEDDPYMGTLMLALAIIPSVEMYKAMPGSKVLMKRGAKGIQELVEKFKSGKKLTKNQLTDLSKFTDDFAKSSSKIKPLMNRQIYQQLIKGLGKKNSKYLANLILILKKLGVINLSKLVLTIGGISYTWDKIYLYVFRDSVFANKKMLDSRTRNGLRAMVNNLLGYEKEVNEFLILTATKSVNDAMNSGVKLVGVNVREAPDKYLDRAIEEQRKKFNYGSPFGEPFKLPAFSTAPTLDEVLSNKKVIKKGEEGESVKKIQKMLYSIGYDDFISDGGAVSKWNDGKYGDSTELAVKTFQSFEGLDGSGIVDMETLNKLMKINEKNYE